MLWNTPRTHSNAPLPRGPVFEPYYRSSRATFQNCVNPAMTTDKTSMVVGVMSAAVPSGDLSPQTVLILADGCRTAVATLIQASLS